MQGAEEIHVHHVAPEIRIGVFHRLPVARVMAVLHQHVDAAEALRRRFHQRLDSGAARRSPLSSSGVSSRGAPAQ
jgi:hypothetical protein